jgi:hypothetical protein
MKAELTAVRRTTGLCTIGFVVVQAAWVRDALPQTTPNNEPSGSSGTVDPQQPGPPTGPPAGFPPDPPAGFPPGPPAGFPPGPPAGFPPGPPAGFPPGLLPGPEVQPETPKDEKPRQSIVGIIANKEAVVPPGASGKRQTFFATTGVLLGGTLALHDVSEYDVINNTVVRTNGNDTDRRFAFATMPFPSVSVLHWLGCKSDGSRNSDDTASECKPLSIILPVQISGGHWAVGVGVTQALFQRAGFEFGIAMGVVGNRKTDLTNQQKESLRTGQPLKPGESAKFDDETRYSLFTGIFVTPKL